MPYRGIFIIFLGLGLLWGCAHVISKEIRSAVDEEITFGELRRDPTAYRGKTVLFGGVIVRSLIEKEGTLLELYQTRVNREGKPIDLDRSEGRFLAFYEGFLDNEIYRNGGRGDHEIGGNQLSISLSHRQGITPLGRRKALCGGTIPLGTMVSMGPVV